MHNINKDRKGIWIPYAIWDNDDLRKYTFQIVNNYYFKEELDIYVWKILQKYGYAKKIFCKSEDIKNFLSKKRSHSYPVSALKLYSCSWCGTITYILHSHHYPISSREGGEKVVEICATCHSEFHFLERIYEFEEKLIQLFKSCEEV